MSMVLCLGTISDANIDKVLQTPRLVMRVLAPDQPELWDTSPTPGLLQELLSLLIGRGKPPAQINGPDLALGEGEGEIIDLDKAWHGIHYLLTGTDSEGDHPANFLVAGGREVGRLDVGYGPARVLTSKETEEVHEHLSALSNEELRSRFNPVTMMNLKIYPTIWDRDPTEDDTLGYLIEHVDLLRTFLAKAVRGRFGIAIWLS